MLNKLRLKFICAMMAVVLVMLCVILGLVLHFTRRQMDQTVINALQHAAGEPGFIPEPHEVPAELPYFVIRRDIWGNYLASGTVNLTRYDETELEEIYEAASRSRKRMGELKRYDLHYMRMSGPGGVRYVFVDVLSQRLAMDHMTRVSITVGVFSFALMLGISVILANWAVKPVEKAWQQQRQFVGDASHELKTPLTVIMTNAELLQSPEYAEEERRQFSDRILTMSHQMRGLVEGLLELARVDNGAVKTAFTQLDFSQLVNEGILPFEPMYFEKGLVLHSCIEDGIVITGSAAHLSQVLEILLDNAMKYSAPNSEIRTELKRTGNHVLLTVENSGPPIEGAELENIFKRFYRADHARSRDGSYGLGLSIAKGIVSDHRGKIWAESRDGINRFCVWLPA